MTHPTLIKPPPPSKDKAPLEDVLELRHLNDIDPNLFTNTRPLWHPPGARGIYGGAVIAQCLAAAQKTVPANFAVHSMHCYFVLNGNAEIPIIYHVEHVREGRSFATRTVQARQRGAPIFTTTLSFVREGSGGKQTVEHRATMADVPAPTDDETVDILRGSRSPFLTQRVGMLNNDSPNIHEKRSRNWIKARGKISDEGGHQAHLSSLAYMSDSYFIGTVAQGHKLWRYGQSNKQGSNGKRPIVPKEVLEKLKEMDIESLRKVEGMDDETINQLKSLEFKDGEIVGFKDAKRPEVTMQVSLDHTIYFHDPKGFRADEWLFTESETPWAGDGRGLVMMKIFTKEGKLIASCIQEGVVRLKQESSKL